MASLERAIIQPSLLDKTTTGYYEVICNSNGTQKSGGGNWSDVPVTQRLSELNGTGRDKWLNKRNWKNFNEAKVEFKKLLNFVKKFPLLRKNTFKFLKFLSTSTEK